MEAILQSVQSDHSVHGHMLSVVSAIGQWPPHPRRSAAVQPTSTSQQAAAAKWLFWHSPGTVATACGWGRQTYNLLMSSSFRIPCAKMIKSVYFWWSYLKNKNVGVFGTQCIRMITLCWRTICITLSLLCSSAASGLICGIVGGCMLAFLSVSFTLPPVRL